MRIFGLKIHALAILALLTSGLTQCSAGAGNLVGGSSGVGSSSFEAGEPIDIPVPVAKSINPIDATTVQATAIGSSTITISAKARAGDVVRLLNKNGTFIAQTTADQQGNFTITTTSISFEDPLVLLVIQGGRSSVPIVVRVYDNGDNDYFTVAVTNQFNIPNLSLAYAPGCGVAFNAISNTGEKAVLCSNVTGSSLAIVAEDLSDSLDQIQFAPDAAFFVGLNSDNQIVRVDSTTNAEVVLSDSASHSSHPGIRLSPDGERVVTTVASGSNSIVAIEPTDVADDQASDRIVINSASPSGNYIDCDWVSDDIIQCIHQLPNGTYEMGLFNLFSTFQSEIRNPELNFIEIDVSPTTEMRNVRIDPFSRVLFTFENITGANLVELLIGDYDDDSAIVATSVGHTSLSNSAWSQDGEFVLFDIDFASSEQTIMGYYEVDTGERTLASFGRAPVSIEENIISYLCEDHLGNTQVCILNQNNVNQ